MVSTVSTRNATKVKRIVVGKPIRRIQTTTGNIDNLAGVSTQGKVDGSLLVYNATSEDFEATTTLDKQEVDGGQY